MSHPWQSTTAKTLPCKSENAVFGDALPLGETNPLRRGKAEGGDGALTRSHVLPLPSGLELASFRKFLPSGCVQQAAH